MIRIAFLAAGLAVCLSAGAHSVSFDPGSHYIVDPAMEDFTTSGEQMAGMQMTVVQGGVSQLYTWGVLQDDYLTYYRGGVITDTFAIWATGDTYCHFVHCAQWMVWQSGLQPITQVVFHGHTGGVVFDLTAMPADNFGTPGSAQGSTFAVAQVQSMLTAVDAVYRNEVSVGGGPVYGDLYTTLELNFAGNGLFGYMQFSADTDLIPATSVIFPPVPEPTSLALLVGGLAVIAVRRQQFRPRKPQTGEPA